MGSELKHVQEADKTADADSAVAVGSPMTPDGNLAIKQMQGRSDSTVGEKFGTVELLADAGRTAGDSMKHAQAMYDKAIPSPDRQKMFHDRMQAIRNFDGQTYSDMLKIADKIGANPPLSPKDAGTELAVALQHTIERARQKGQAVDLGSDNMTTVLGGMSGLMLAERGTFAPGKAEAATREMVDAAEAQLALDKKPQGVMSMDKSGPIPMRIHGVMWADNGEP
ncbi:MAG: hypothetical protein JSS86_20685, partial [Cyanobacteria bacterium SZAS LIN-2]|nr:hypothetical protein [Cyanobacteria bacterium SZAS LIN-2]